MATTLAAYIYDATSGLAKRVVVSDDYKTPDALIAAHCAAGESAVVAEYRGTLQENKVAMAIAQLDDDGVQTIVTEHCKIEPPPKVRYALTGPTGKVFEVVETRVPTDPRLHRHAAFEAAKAVKQADFDAATSVVMQWPDLELLPSKSITQAMRDAHQLVAQAKQYGLVDDDAVRADPEGAVVQKVADRVAGFTVLKSDAVDIDDKIDPDGGIRKRIVEQPPPDKPIVGDTRIVL